MLSNLLQRSPRSHRAAFIRLLLGGLIFTLAGLTALQAQSTRYVKQGGSGDGSSWDNASGNLQAMIDADGVQQVWVAAGTYKPTTSTDQNVSFHMKNEVSILGGFPASGAPGMAERNPATNATILSGDLGGGTHSYNIFLNGEGLNLNTTSVLDGFIIRDGRAGGLFPKSTGAGMFNINCSPSLLNCMFINNYAVGGAALYNFNSHPLVINCSFVNNSTNRGSGGAVRNQNSRSTFINCSFTGNYAGIGGGAIENFENSAPTLTNCILWGNSAREVGSQIYDQPGSSATITYSLIQGGYPGLNNLDQDPRFVDAANGNLQLQACSPAIDAGNNGANSALTDLAANPRKLRTIDMGAYEFQGSPTPPVIITSQPPSGSAVCAGSTVSVSVVATGNSPLAYQWFKDGSPLSPAQTTATLSLTNVQTTNAGSYSVVITNICGPVTSTAFSLTVNQGEAPSLVSANGQPYYPAGVSNLTLFQYSGNVVLIASGCQGGTLNWSGGSATSLSVPTTTTGVFTYTAICTRNGCTSPLASATVTIQAGALQLLAPTYDCFSGAIHFNTQGGNGTLIEYFAPGITPWTTNPDQFVDRLLRTAADASPITLTARQSGKETKYRFDIRAQCQSTPNQAPKLSKAIPAQTALQGGTFAYRIPPGTFTDYENQPLTLSVGGLPDGLGFTANERLSGIPSQAGSFSLIVKATDPQGYSAQGVLVLTVVASSNSLQLLAPDYNCQTGAIVFKTQGGNTSKIEYFATGITGWTTNANQVVEKGLRTDAKLLILLARQSGREVSLFFDLQARCGSPRQGAEEPSESALQVVVLGNPVSGQAVDVLVQGAVGHPLAVRLMDSQGRVVHRQTHAPTGQEQRLSVALPEESAGLLLLEVSTPHQRQTVRLVKSR